MNADEFFDCCGLAIISELDMGESKQFAWQTMHEDPEIFETELRRTMKHNSDYKNFVLVTNPEQKMFEPVLEKHGFVPVIDGFYNRNTGNRLVMWFKSSRSLRLPKHRRGKHK